MSDYTYEDAKKSLDELKEADASEFFHTGAIYPVTKLVIWLAECELERTSNKKQDIEHGIICRGDEIEELKPFIRECLDTIDNDGKRHPYVKLTPPE